MKDFLIIFVMAAIIFLAGFIIGAFTEDRENKKLEEKRKRYEIDKNNGYLQNINTALWSLMNDGIKVRRLKKKPLLANQNLKKNVISEQLRREKSDDLNLLKRANVKNEFEGTAWS